MRSSDCADCGVDTWALGEMYMVRHDLWKWAVGDRYLVYDYDGRLKDKTGPGTVMLCIGCLEHRIGRELEPDDFTDAPINWCPMAGNGHQSNRLKDRLRIEA